MKGSIGDSLAKELAARDCHAYAISTRRVATMGDRIKVANIALDVAD